VLTGLPPRNPTASHPVPNTSFPAMLNTRLLEAARGGTVDQVPVWVMRQAGRYLPEFWKMKEKYDFFTMCTTPEVACEVTLQPIRRFPLDAAIIFSDILVVPQFMGMEVQMLPGKGPSFPQPLETPADLERLCRPDPNTAFEAYLDAIYLTRHSLQGKVPLIGFTGGPFTLFTYMIEGGGSTAFTKARKWIFAYPEASKRLLDLITEVVCDFLLAQICSGAQILQVFESHAGVLGPEDYEEFILPYQERIAKFLKEKARQDERLDVPLIIFAKDAGFALEMLVKTEYDVIGLDWTVDLEKAGELARKAGKAVQGNLDPAILYAEEEVVRRRARKMVEKGGKVGYIANLGHGIYPDVKPESLGAFIDAVHQF
jgi:uroporphyrinogen decarboxylase